MFSVLIMLVRMQSGLTNVEGL